MRLKFPALSVTAAACAWFLPAAVQAQPAGKTAEQAFKNIQVLNGTPADQLFPAMQFIAASLGVECDFCHVQGKFDADDKPEKKTARKMIAMTLAINKDSFNSPQGSDMLLVPSWQARSGGNAAGVTSDAEPEHAEAAPAPVAVTADQILDKYVAAVGGAAALHKISSRVSKGSISFGGHETPIEVFAKAPDKRMSVTHSERGDSITAFDGQGGWLGNNRTSDARDVGGRKRMPRAWTPISICHAHQGDLHQLPRRTAR